MTPSSWTLHQRNRKAAPRFPGAGSSDPRRSLANNLPPKYQTGREKPSYKIQSQKECYKRNVPIIERDSFPLPGFKLDSLNPPFPLHIFTPTQPPDTLAIEYTYTYAGIIYVHVYILWSAYTKWIASPTIFYFSGFIGWLHRVLAVSLFPPDFQNYSFILDVPVACTTIFSVSRSDLLYGWKHLMMPWKKVAKT